MLTLSTQWAAAGTLADRIDGTVARIRKEPGRADLRVLLIQLFCVMGEWQRAISQLSAVAGLDPGTEEMARAYREVIRSEVYRGQVFAGGRTPLFVGEPEMWLARLVEALRLNACGRTHEAAALRAEALAEAPASAGHIGENRFEWIADADSRLGPVVEAIVNGKYYWIPFHRLAQMEIEAPVDMRDLVWVPARLTFASGGAQVAFIPVRYPGTETNSDDEFRLARKTDWQDIGDVTYIGTGQRMFATDTGEFPLLDTRLVEFGLN